MNIFDSYRLEANPDLAVQMQAYMRNQFKFLGIQTKRRVEITKVFFKEIKFEKEFNWAFVFSCFSMEEREFQYLGLSYLSKKWMLIHENEFVNIEKLAFIKPWWDSIDSIAPYIGHLVIKYPTLKNKFIYKWMNSGELWLIRWSIIYQLKYKKDTDLNTLTDVILQNYSTKEFFINKAIGWALREYAKTNPEWVINFINNNNLSNLSKREASKHLSL